MSRDSDSSVDDLLELVAGDRYSLRIKEFDGKPAFSNGFNKRRLDEIVHTFPPSHLEKRLGQILNKYVSPKRFESCKDLMNLVTDRCRRVSYFDSLESIFKNRRRVTVYLQNKEYPFKAEVRDTFDDQPHLLIDRNFVTVLSIIIVILFIIAGIAYVICMSPRI